MAEGTYEYECMRAELLGIAKPDEEEFEKARAERLQQEQDEKDAAEAQMLDEQDEALKGTGSRLDELTGILSSTQQKLNRFKQSACGSLSNIFSRSGSVDAVKTQPNEDTPNTSSRRNTTAAHISTDINEALDNVQQQDVQPIIPTEKIHQAKLDLDQKKSSHLDTLDRMINQAEQAEIAMHEQTKQMRKMAK